MRNLSVVIWVLVIPFLCLGESAYGIGANWGTQCSHQLPPETVVRLLKENGIQRVKLFDADYGALKALANSGIEVMVGIPNDLLYTLATSSKAAERWVSKNVSTYNNVQIRWRVCTKDLGYNCALCVKDDNDTYFILMSASCERSCLRSYSSLYNPFKPSLELIAPRYVAVGNEPFLATYNGSFLRTTFPAMQNIQNALVKAGLGNKVKVTCPLNADVYESLTGVPSSGDFRADIHDYVIQIVKFLSDNGSPFTVNIYPFISLYIDSNFPVEYAFFDGNASPINDGGTNYNNMFDANHDTLVWALQKNGYPNLPIIVGEIGWPTDGDRNANNEYAQRFNQGFMSHIANGKGTPMRPSPIDAYLFSLIDEDEKSIDPGNFERHWGIFYYDGLPKYSLNLGTTNTGALVPARNVKYLQKKWCVMKNSAGLDNPSVSTSVSYACALGDCTSLGYLTSCGGLDARGNISYAFNSYYQKSNQQDEACKFPNVSMITKVDPSTPSCRFGIMIEPYYGAAERSYGPIKQRYGIIAGFLLFLFTVM